MAITFSLTQVHQPKSAAWIAEWDPAERDVLAGQLAPSARRSVVLVRGHVRETRGQIEFAAVDSSLVVCGVTREVVVVALASEGGTTDLQDRSAPQDDRDRLYNLAQRHVPELAQPLKELIDELQSEIPFELRFNERSGKFIANPNFFTVKIQPRVKDLHFTVRGWPSDFEARDLPTPARDQNSYSSFNVGKQRNGIRVYSWSQAKKAIRLAIAIKNKSLTRP
jgi:hypothetical protein